MRNRTENKIELVLIRHGAAASNQEHRYLGRTEEGISADGRAGLLRRKESGYYPPADCLLSSPMKRCVETAQLLYPAQRAVLIPEWTEIDFGSFEGKTYQELQGDRRYQEWIDSGGRLPFPDGESREDFIARSVRGLCRLEGILAGEESRQRERALTAAAVVHGGTIMALLSHFCGGDYFSYQVRNGEGYRVCLEESREGIRITEAERIKGE